MLNGAATYSEVSDRVPEPFMRAAIPTMARADFLRFPAFFTASHGVAAEIQKSPIRAQPGAGIGDGVWTQRNGCGRVP